MKKIMLEVTVPEDYDDVCAELIISDMLKDVNPEYWNYRIIEPAVQSQDAPIHQYRHKNDDEGEWTDTQFIANFEHLPQYETRTLFKAAIVHGEPVIRIKIVNKGKGDDITGWSNLGRLQPGVYELFTRPIIDGNGRDTEILQFISDKFDTMKTSSSKTFVSLLGFDNENDYCADLRLLIETILATPPQSDAQESES